ncbi:MAG: hypothetical protein ACI9PC_001645 [Porticoccaceae bacterium]|jgi:hypothetical protein
MEARGDSHYRVQELIRRDQKIKFLNPKLIKYYLKRNKNNYNDAESYLCLFMPIYAVFKIYKLSLNFTKVVFLWRQI